MTPRHCFAGIALLSAAALAGPESFVNAKSYDYKVVVDMRWHKPDTPMGRSMYPVDRCLLRKEAAQALSRAQAALAIGGFRLKLVDCYRPSSIDSEMRAKLGDDAGSDALPGGAAVEVTLVDNRGSEVAMPTALGSDKSDEAKSSARRERAKRNAARLEEALEKEGFKKSGPGWWSFRLPGDFPAENFPLTAIR